MCCTTFTSTSIWCPRDPHRREGRRHSPLDVTVNDMTFTSGQFAFFNNSQQDVRYAGFEREGGVTVPSPRPSRSSDSGWPGWAFFVAAGRSDSTPEVIKARRVRALSFSGAAGGSREDCSKRPAAKLSDRAPDVATPGSCCVVSAVWSKAPHDATFVLIFRHSRLTSAPLAHASASVSSTRTYRPSRCTRR